MKIDCLYFLVLLFASVCWSVDVNAQDWNRCNETSQNGVFKIKTTIVDDDGTNTVTEEGTGFFVTVDGYALTANHVVRKDPNKIAKYEVQFGPFRVTLNESDVIDSSRDIAVIRVPNGMKHKPLHLKDASKARRGDRLLATGFPLESGLSNASGELSSTRASNGLWLTTINASPGYSGAPVFNKNCEVVAVLNEGRFGDAQEKVTPLFRVKSMIERIPLSLEPQICDSKPASCIDWEANRSVCRLYSVKLNYSGKGGHTEKGVLNCLPSNQQLKVTLDAKVGIIGYNGGPKDDCSIISNYNGVKKRNIFCGNFQSPVKKAYSDHTNSGNRGRLNYKLRFFECGDGQACSVDGMLIVGSK